MFWVLWFSWLFSLLRGFCCCWVKVFVTFGIFICFWVVLIAYCGFLFLGFKFGCFVVVYFISCGFGYGWWRFGLLVDLSWGGLIRFDFWCGFISYNWLLICGFWSLMVMDCLVVSLFSGDYLLLGGLVDYLFCLLLFGFELVA